jgi:4-amino-4-deoxy-L-arabinose transferase-like glycosyltransferase
MKVVARFARSRIDLPNRFTKDQIEMAQSKKTLQPSDLQLLILLAAIRFVIHLLANDQYGFHRDALAFLDNGRQLSWGYVEYPPLTPFIGRIGLELFGLSLVGIKSLAALAQCTAMVLAGLMAKELGGGRKAQLVTAVAVAIAPMSLLMATLFQYISFDYLWWVLIAYLMIRLLKSDDPRWWLGIGAVIGVGMMTKYTIIYLAAGLVAAVLLTKSHRHLKSPWLWGGAALSLLIFLPNLLWQVQHDFISLEFLSAIHERDVAIGRSEGYFSQQLYVNANPLLIFLWIIGLYYYFFHKDGVRYRALGWLYLVPLLLFWLSDGRFYYLAPAYPMLIAAGAVAGEQWLARVSENGRRLAYGLLAVLTVAGAAVGAVLMMPIAPVNSGLWDFTSDIHDNFAEQIGWEELAGNVAGIYHEALPNNPSLGILTGNYGEAAAINLFGEAYDLPPVISPINSYWLRGYGSAPQAVIVVGFDRETVDRLFADCEIVGQNGNSLGVENEESRFHQEIFLCTRPLFFWEAVWPQLQSFG